MEPARAAARRLVARGEVEITQAGPRRRRLDGRRAPSASADARRDDASARSRCDSVKVEIWSDVVCPWCYIGKRRFEQALAGFPHRDEVEVVWRAFELDPRHLPSARAATPRTSPRSTASRCPRRSG
jgi:protein-disulfide isomerase